MNSSIRPARRDDAAFLAQVMLLAARSHLKQGAYEKAGFKVADEKRHLDFEATVGEPGMRRLWLSLSRLNQ